MVSAPDIGTKTAAQAEMFAHRLAKRQKHLRKWARRTGAGVYRLYDRDIPEIPLVLDRYDPADSGQEPALAGALYERPYEKDPAEEKAWLTVMIQTAAKTLALPEERIFLRVRSRGGPGRRGSPGFGNPAGFENPAASPDKGPLTMTVTEGGLRFGVNLNGSLDTGLFPDRRLLRSRIRQEAAGRRVLNLFAYTGSFSVYAAAGGAAGVDSVDLSAAYLDRARRNFLLNGFAVKQKGTDSRNFPGTEFRRGTGADKAGGGSGSDKPAYRFIRTDALRFLEEAAGRRRWDLIILDPPTFSNSKKMSGTLDIRRDHKELLERCLSLLEPEGVLYLSVNARHFRPEESALEERIPGLVMRSLTEAMRDEDFTGRSVPACYRISRKGFH
ncbi:MAG: class I SAM-dependent methyltransferase [Spirochaetaceae bacterium]|nr:class I SAM-dependent methyltransferase [Spirochaetaceae bacterium]